MNEIYGIPGLYPTGCWCHTCRPIDYNDPDSVYMRLCPICGNKRCPKATDHRLDCTNSNDPGQKGSIYGGMDPRNKFDGKTNE